MVEEITAKKALNKLNSTFLPYKYDLNVYRGCPHKCQYCYALYSHKFLDDSKFFDKIFVKTNIVECLEKQLSSKRWKPSTINLGGVTDNYQITESKYRLMPEILKLMIKYKNPITISTKSDLILRDIDLFEQLAKVTMVNVAVTITTMDENLRSKIEPGAVSSLRRINVLKQFKNKNIGLGLHLMPILPFITDTSENIENIFKEVSSIPIDYAICSLLNLRSYTRINYFDFIKKNFPSLFPKYLELYKTPFAQKEYRSTIYPMVYELKKKYKINDDYHKFLPKDSSPLQLNLLD